jgi:hypothetical protein
MSRSPKSGYAFGFSREFPSGGEWSCGVNDSLCGSIMFQGFGQDCQSENKFRPILSSVVSSCVYLVLVLELTN